MYKQLTCVHVQSMKCVWPTHTSTLFKINIMRRSRRTLRQMFPYHDEKQNINYSNNTYIYVKQDDLKLRYRYYLFLEASLSFFPSPFAFVITLSRRWEERERERGRNKHGIHRLCGRLRITLFPLRFISSLPPPPSWNLRVVNPRNEVAENFAP